MRRSEAHVFTLISLLALASRALSGQCPDGSAAPCGVRAIAPVPPASERGRRFLVLPFRNLSRGSEQEWLVEGATSMLGESLGRWREIHVVADDRLYPAMRRYGLTAGAIIAPERVRRLAEETGGWTAVSGDIVSSGGRLRVSARAYDVVTNRDVVARFTVDAPTSADVRPLFESIATRLLHGAGLDTATASLATITTRSLDAYRAYLLGVRHINRAQFRQARDVLLQAVRLDSAFAQAHFLLIEAALGADPFSVMTPGTVLSRSYDRSLALADHFAPSERELFLGVDAIFSGRLTAAREILDARIARDSNDLRAVSWLSFLEYADGILVTLPGGGERRRGSVNENLRLARRVLAMDPARHDAFVPIMGQYLLAAGAFPGIQPGWRRETGNLVRLFTSAPARVFVPLLMDSIVMVPAESLFAIAPDALVAARRRALDSAVAVSNRWLAVGPTEGTARHMAAEVAVMTGEYERALEQLRIADSFGNELGVLDSRLLRMSILARLGRYDAARRSIESDAARKRISMDVGLAFLDEGMAASWAFNLHVMAGDTVNANDLLGMRTRFVRGMLPDSAMARGIALTMLAGDRMPPLWQVELPLGFRMDVLDSARARALGSAGSSAELVRVAMAGMVSRAALRPGGNDALAERARKSAWFVP